MKKIFYVIGCGPSINDITDEEWDYLKDKNTISFSCFPYSGIKTKHYFSIESINIDRYMLYLIAKNRYIDTKLYLYLPQSIFWAIELGFKDIYQINKQHAYFGPLREPWFTDEPNPPYKLKDCIAKSFCDPILRFRGQLSAVINTSLILGATEIRLVGIDLNCQKNFFENVYQEEVNQRWIKDQTSIDIYKDLTSGSKERLIKKKLNHEMFKDYDEKTIHTTELPYIDRNKFGDRKLRPVSDVVEWIDKELKEEGMNGIYITNKTSTLYTKNKLEYKSIMED